MRTAIASVCVLVALGLSGCTAEMKARAYAGADRDEWQQPERVVAALGVETGDRVGDLGSGGGYFTFRLAEAVGSTGRVYALDVDEAMNERLERLAAERGADNVEVILAAPNDPNLPEPVDLLFTSNTYHHIDDRLAYFERVANSLRPGGRVAILEFREEGFFHSILGHATAADLIRTEMEAAGYRRVDDHDWLERQHFLVFELASSTARADAGTHPGLVECTEPRSPMCTRDYRPVCALVDTGVRCVTEPCDSTEWRTYSNGCSACADAGVVGHREGACTD